MKIKMLFLLSLLAAAVACDTSKEGGKVPSYTDEPSYPEAFASMQHVIAEGVDYDITNVEELLSSNYWQLDAVLGYNQDFTKVTSVVRDFAECSNREDDSQIYGFGRETVVCYDIDSKDGTVIQENGEWSYAPRTLTMTVSIPSFDDNNAIDMEFTLLSLTTESAVLEWTSQEGAYRASLRPSMSLTDLLHRSATIVAEKILVQCGEFNDEVFVDGLIGMWKVDSQLCYDSSWQYVEQAHLLLGFWYAVGGAAPSFEFAADGTGAMHSISTAEPPFEEYVLPFNWVYNSDTDMLAISGESVNLTYHISGYSGLYIVADSESEVNGNLRQILKRK